MKPNGNISYKDEYGQLYHSEWTTTSGIIDITTTVKQPYVWGERREIKIIDGVTFRSGIITIDRQLIKVYEGGYEIIADGSTQYKDYVDFRSPTSKTFRYNLNHPITDGVNYEVTVGPCFGDHVFWGVVDNNGNFQSNPTEETLYFIDIWGEN